MLSRCHDSRFKIIKIFATSLEIQIIHSTKQYTNGAAAKYGVITQNGTGFSFKKKFYFKFAFTFVLHYGLKNSRHLIIQSDVKPDQSRLVRTGFPSCMLCALWLARVLNLVLVLRYSINKGVIWQLVTTLTNLNSQKDQESRCQGTQCTFWIIRNFRFVRFLKRKTTNQKWGELVIEQSLFEFPMHAVHERNALLLGKNWRLCFI